jgi:hypothetical protein
MDILMSMARSLLFISGLRPETFWEAALEHAVQIQIRTALPGRPTPLELTVGRRPNVATLRIFGCEALSYMEKHKRTKLQPKVERTIYLGMSPNHSNDTYKLMKISNQEIIYRRNVYFNERSFPARKFQLPPTLTAVDTGADLIGADFDDEGSRWTVLKTGEYEGTPVLYYKHKDNGTEECSSVAEVRTWVNQTTLHQATNTLTPTRKGYINTLAEESFKAITNYNLKLPPNSTKPTSFKKAGNQPLPQWFRAEGTKQGARRFYGYTASVNGTAS